MEREEKKVRIRRSKEQVLRDNIMKIDEKIEFHSIQIKELKDKKVELEKELNDLLEAANLEKKKAELEKLASLVDESGFSVEELIRCAEEKKTFVTEE